MLKEITEEEESKYGSKGRHVIKEEEDSICELLNEVTGSRLLEETLLNCSLSLSENVESVSKISTGIPSIAETSRITLDLHKLD